MLINDKLVAKLKEPLNGESFCGPYLKLDRQAFRALRNVYNEANSAARLLMQTPDESELDALIENNNESWKKLSDVLGKTFQEQTRDFELLSWMLVSQIYTDATLKGFRNGMEILHCYVTEHFAEMNPMMAESSIRAEDEAGKNKELINFRLQAFMQLAGTTDNDSILYAPLSQLKLVGDVTSFAYMSAEMKGECPRLRDENQKNVREEREQIEEIIKNIRESKTFAEESYRSLLALCQPLSIPVPNFNFIIKLLERMLSIIQFITGFSIEEQKEEESVSEATEQLKEASAEVSTVETQSVVSAKAAPVKTAEAGMVSNQRTYKEISECTQKNREQIFDELRGIAEYFKSTEPHSPVAYLIEKAIRWGHMSLPELLDELISDQQDTRNRIFTIAGLQEGGSGFTVNSSPSANTETAPQVSHNQISTQQQNDMPQINW